MFSFQWLKMVNYKFHTFLNRLFLVSMYYPLHYFQFLVDQSGLYYNRWFFPKTLEPYRINSSPAHIRFTKYLFLFYIFRCSFIIFSPLARSSLHARILLGAEIAGADSRYIEMTFLVWALICYLFLHCTLSSNLFDYKFLALLRITTNSCRNGEFVHPVMLGLKESSYRKFKLFRSGAFIYYNIVIWSIVPFSILAIIWLTMLKNFYTTHYISSLFWTFTHCIEIYLVVAILYSALIIFMIVSFYIYLKQQSIIERISLICVRLLGKVGQSRWSYLRTHRRVSSLVRQMIKYSYLQEEICQYNSFWSSYLSIVFINYVLLISFILYVLLFGQTALVIKVSYFLVFLFHILSMMAIIGICGKIIKGNERLACRLVSLAGQMKAGRMSHASHLKLHSLSENIGKVAQSGFCLLNGYLITLDTYRLLLVNIVVYFLLILGNTK